MAERKERAPLPATFKRLSSNVVVLLDPKNDRLIYLVGASVEDSFPDRLVEQLRALLRAAAAPYVHLVALPSRLRVALLREFPGGSPIISQMPLPEHLQLTADQALPPEQQQRQEQQPEQGGGVLDLLYGRDRHRLERGAPARAAGHGSEDVAEEPGLHGFEAPADVPDEVMSRRKKLPYLAEWQQGVSTRVALRRDGFQWYKLHDLVAGFNEFGFMTAFLAAPGILFVRNHVADSMDIDMGSSAVSSRGAYAFRSEEGVRLDGEAADHTGDEDDEENGAGKGESAELFATVGFTEKEMDGLIELLKEMGLDSELSEDSDSDEDEYLAHKDDSDSDEDAAGQESEANGGTDHSAASMSSSVHPFVEEIKILSIGPSNGAGATGPGAVGPSEDPAGDDFQWLAELMDVPFNMDMALSSGPMGWRAVLQVNDKLASLRGEAGAVEEAARAEADHLANVQRLEALWQQQSSPEPAAAARPEGEPADSSGGGCPAGTSDGSVDASITGARVSASGDQKADAAAAGTEGGKGEGESDLLTRLSSHSGLEDDWQLAESRAAAALTSGGRARRRAGGAGEGAGTGHGQGQAAGWEVPTDRLIRPAKRPGFPAGGGPAHASVASGSAVEGPGGAQDAVGSSGGAGSSGVSVGLAAQGATSGAAGVQGARVDAAGGEFIASTRLRRAVSPGGKDSADSSSSSSMAGDKEREPADQPESEDGAGEAEEEGENDLSGSGVTAASGSGRSGSPGDAPAGRSRTGRLRMVRRPRRPLRSSGGHTPTAGGDAADQPPTPGAGPGAQAIDGAAGTSGGGAIPVPAYKVLRPQGGSQTPPAPSASPASGLNGHPAVPGLGKSQRGRLGAQPPAVPPTPGAPAAGSPPGSMVTPEAAGYHAMDLDQMAQFVLGRQASPEEVHDLARAVAQSAEVEDAFTAASSAATNPLQPHPQPQRGQPLGGGYDTFNWRRPGTPHPTEREFMQIMNRSPRSVIRPRCRRLRIPPRVVKLMGKEASQAQAAAAASEEERGPAGHGAPRDVPDVRVSRGKVRETRTLPTSRLSRRSGGQPRPASKAGEAPSQEALAEEAVKAFLSAPELERQRAEELLAFLRGRRPKGADIGWGGPGLRSPGGLPGLTRGRDAVVVVPQELLQVAVGGWHAVEKRLMHPDVLAGGQL